ncbi:ketopantoate reductase family protein [Thalassotalea sp. ND16A]|uniref:ketopantoate reductase family protein n=1 Tax=Thalassotalea sp. ND16A TaxID=1535422 RepID=UPI00051A019D|nr:2-dehydropantoate 2-reductase [Thalassotalea sp. ND16A]KGJ90284.1 2-dehydropantoate 2-reductase [Thalassotalea sp. ND16A]
MNIVIIGQGAIGLLFCHYLRGNQLSLKTRAMVKSTATYTFTNIHGCSRQYPITIADVEQLTRADCIICCVKSYDVSAALEEVLPLLQKNCAIILTHNGMGVVETLQLEQDFNNPIYALVTTMAAKKLAHSHVLHTGEGSNNMGLVAGSSSAGEQQQLLSVLKSHIPNLSLTSAIKQLQWQKLAINAAINGLTAIYNVNNGELAKQSYQDKIQAIVAEVVQVALAEGVSFEQAELMNTIKLVIENTSKNSSSMREDVRKQQQTEVAYINGYIVDMGKKHRISTPCNQQLLQQVNEITATR